MADQKPVVGIIMGSKSDLGVMEGCTAELEALGVPYELVIASAHRTPAKVHEWASTAADRGIKVIIAAAGKAAHLGGVVAAFTPLPVIGVPMKTSDLGKIFQIHQHLVVCHCNNRAGHNIALMQAFERRLQLLGIVLHCLYQLFILIHPGISPFRSFYTLLGGKTLLTI